VVTACRSFAELSSRRAVRSRASRYTIDQIGDCEGLEQFGISAIIAARRELPSAYLRACVGLLPKHRFYRRLFSSCRGLRHARPRGVLIWLPALLGCESKHHAINHYDPKQRPCLGEVSLPPRGHRGPSNAAAMVADILSAAATRAASGRRM
jgi:hypothetical protein